MNFAKASFCEENGLQVINIYKTLQFYIYSYILLIFLVSVLGSAKKSSNYFGELK
jgi:hypothetical protein